MQWTSNSDPGSTPAVAPAAAPRPDPNSPWRSPWVMAWLGLIVVVLAVNGTMVYLAIATSPGLVTPEYYGRGQAYEQTVTSRMARAPDWMMRAGLADPLLDRPGPAWLVLVDRAGQPVDVDDVTLYAYRPADAAQDFSVPMAREAKGRYQTQVAFPRLGVWDLLFAVRSGEDEYTISERIYVEHP